MSDKSVRFSLFLLILFNFIDIITTSLFINYLNIAEELNPLMDIVLSWGTIYFILVKVFAVSFACVVFWRYRMRKLAKFGILISLIGYFTLMVYFCVHIL